jgi:hypothetical protein
MEVYLSGEKDGKIERSGGKKKKKPCGGGARL